MQNLAIDTQERVQIGNSGDALRIVNPELRFQKVVLSDPSPSRFLHLAAEIDSGVAFLWSSGKKRRALAACKRAARELARLPGVHGAHVFKALVIPPGRGAYLKRRPNAVHIVRFDLAVLFECESEVALDRVRAHSAYLRMLLAIERVARHVHLTEATNIRRIAAVDHTRQGVFLFNHFYAEDVQQNLAVWDYTAGWFQAETELDNSTALMPTDPSRCDYAIINHCRWDRLRDVLPSLIFKRSFHSYVLANFAANRVAAMPILYNLA